MGLYCQKLLATTIICSVRGFNINSAGYILFNLWSYTRIAKLVNFIAVISEINARFLCFQINSGDNSGNLMKALRKIANINTGLRERFRLLYIFYDLNRR